MKYSFSLGTTSCASNLALWYWNEMSEMIGVCGYDGLEIPFQAWSFNGGRGAAPVCAAAIRTKFGSVSNYQNFLKDCGISEGLSGLHITAQNILSTMLEDNCPREKIFERTLDLAKETVNVLSEAGSRDLIFSPSPMLAMFYGVFRDSDVAGSYEDRIAETIGQMAEMVKGSGIRISLRNEFYGMFRGEKIESLLRKLPESVLYSPDLAQIYIDGADPVEMVKRHRGRLAAVKMDDTDFIDTAGCYATAMPEAPQEGEKQRVYCTFGNGKVDKTGAYRTLQEGGYDDWIVMESKQAFNIEKTMIKMQSYKRKNFR